MNAMLPDSWRSEDLVFLPLGGAGEIGMNLNLYGHAGKWLMVDLGITFPGEEEPGIEVIVPDPAFIEERREDLLGIVVTHAHEDHLGAVHHLWRRLRCPVYATPFAAAVLRQKLAEAKLLGEVEVVEVPLGGSLQIGPFAIDFISITHSIPEPNALAIRTPVGTVLHTGDWKLDPAPLLGATTDEAALRRLGDAGVLAIVCDSTNVFSPGTSGSESEVRETLMRLVEGRQGRVAITTFASHSARVQTVAEVARAHGRQLCVVGRSLWRLLEAARTAGYLRDIGPLLQDTEGGWLPPDKVLYLCTGCQGEPRGAMARIAAGQHQHVVLEAGDVAIFSSKVIPGNEIAIARMHDRLAVAGVEVIGEGDARVHVSGHPCRDELARMYQWARPHIAVPVHGELRHLHEHARLAASLQVPQVCVAANGQVLRLGPGEPEIVAEVPAGRLYLDGKALVGRDDAGFRARRKLVHNGAVVVTLVLDPAGRLAVPPVLLPQGIAGAGVVADIESRGATAVAAAVEAMPKAARREDERLADATRNALRRLLKAATDKRPAIEVQVLRLGG